MPVKTASTVQPKRRAQRITSGPASLPHPFTARVTVASGTSEPAAAPPVLPALDEATKRTLLTISDLATRCHEATDFIMACIALTASLAAVETDLSLPPGFLSGHLLTTRELAMRWSVALHESAALFDDRAMSLLCRVYGGSAKNYDVRALYNQSNVWRCRAEAARRMSEALARKSHDIIADKARSKAVKAKAVQTQEAFARRAVTTAEVHPLFRVGPARDPLYDVSIDQLEALINWASSRLSAAQNDGGDTFELEQQLEQAQAVLQYRLDDQRRMARITAPA